MGRGSPELSPVTSIHSNMSMTSNDESQVHKLEQLVEAGNWEEVMAHANKIDDVSTDHSMSDNSMRSADSVQQLSPVSSPGSTGHVVGEGRDILDIVTEIAELVEMVVPDELENLDSMLLHFRGREEELVKTLHNMQDEKLGQDECYKQLSKASFTLESDSTQREQ